MFIGTEVHVTCNIDENFFHVLQFNSIHSNTTNSLLSKCSCLLPVHPHQLVMMVEILFPSIRTNSPKNKCQYYRLLCCRTIQFMAQC